jgi:putative aldouronate transport system permease protein
MSATQNKGISPARVLIHLFFILFSLCFILPFIMIVSASFSNEDVLKNAGFGLLPAQFDLTAYRYVFSNPQSILQAYKVTAFQSFLGTFLSVLIMALCAYPLSVPNYKLRSPLTFFIFFTMLFNGGLIPTYILTTQYLHLGNTIWVYIFPSLANAFSIIVIRTFFQGLPPSLAESAKIDGASALLIFFRIILPLSKPVLATMALFGLLDRWNNWYTAIIYIKDAGLYSLQYLLQKILMEIEFIKALAEMVPQGIDASMVSKPPSETMKFAMCVVAAGPMLIVFPFFQKYFTKGLTVGAVKG